MTTEATMDRNVAMAADRLLLAKMLCEWDEAARMGHMRYGRHIVTGFGSSPLHKVVEHRSVDDVKAYLKERSTFDVDVPDPFSGSTPLLLACTLGKVETVKLLIKHGADINYKCAGLSGDGLAYSNITPLYIAAEAGHLEVVKYLTLRGADVNVKCAPLGFTALHRAVCNGHKAVVDYLIKEAGACVSILMSDGDSPVLSAIRSRRTAILRSLLELGGADPNIAHANEGVTPLHLAAFHNKLQSVRLLLEFEADVNSKLKCGHTPLDLAVQRRNDEIVSVLRGRGALRNVTSERWAPYFSCALGGLQMLKQAVSRGADIDAPIYKGGTALHLSVAKLRMDSCKFLLRKGANICKKDHFGRAPLHIAAGLGWNEGVELLIEKGTSVNESIE